MNYTIPEQIQRRSRWLNSDLRIYKGGVDVVRRHIPEFERRSFGLIQEGGSSTRLNECLDAIIRKPVDDDRDCVPIGIVSKNYVFVPHSRVLDLAVKAINKMGVEDGDIASEMILSQYGERMALSLFLPSKYDYSPGDKDVMRLRLVCWNSVEGSGRFRAFVGWFRLICSNGLIVGITRLDIRRRHAGNMNLSDIQNVLARGLDYSIQDKKKFEEWKKNNIREDKWMPWVEGPLKRKWGIKAAARVNHIARSGYDAIVPVPILAKRVTDLYLEQGKKVPGCHSPATNAFEICQILAWIARERTDFQEQLAWQQQIPSLMKNLLN